jgi:hypothetical protein
MKATSFLLMVMLALALSATAHPLLNTKDQPSVLEARTTAEEATSSDSAPADIGGYSGDPVKNVSATLLPSSVFLLTLLSPHPHPDQGRKAKWRDFG